MAREVQEALGDPVPGTRYPAGRNAKRRSVMDTQLRIVALSDREIQITRGFNAPRKLVFDAYTKPELVRKWLFGPPGWTFKVCEIDRSEEHTSELQSHVNLVCRLLLEK